MSFYVPNQGEGILENTSHFEATGRSSGSMEQGQLQARNLNINAENELQQLNQDPDSEVGMTESNQRKRKITCSSVQPKLKNYRDTLRRMIVKTKELKDEIKEMELKVKELKDKIKEMESSLMKLKKNVDRKISKYDHASDKIFEDDLAWVAELNKMFLAQEWPVEMDVDKIWTDADNVKKSIEKAKKDGSFNIREAELGQEVGKIGEDIKALQNSSMKFCENSECFEGISSSDLTAQGFSSSDLNARGLNAQAPAQGISSSRTCYEEDLCEYAEDFLEKLLDKENNNVEISDFKCLDLTCDNVPTPEFNSIDSKLRKLCGTAYEEAGFLAEEKLLVLAAIKEMGEELVDKSMLLKWGAAFNKGEQVGYRMDFAKKRLELLARAFFGSHSLIKEKFNRMQKYVKAVGDVGQMESFTDGMFPSDV